MNAQSHLRRATKATLLSRMEATRIQLLATNVHVRIRDLRPVSGANASTPAHLGRAFSAIPAVTLLAPVLLGLLILGPTRLAPLVVRTGLKAWVTRNVRALVGG